ncbi:hypothetical protein EVJ23_10615 [Exiguobacterium sp. SH1S1]|nr:hypothetical protein EVJ31_10625 [Exiguobacterium sp. SH5S32]TCI69524.1 hypothetical protein EVJ23_10615 [Exiguobacterium sp. SH1S1]
MRHPFDRVNLGEQSTTRLSTERMRQMSDKDKREQEEQEKLNRDQPDISHEEDSKGDHSDLEETDEDEQS